jgi:hypothetical protein
VAQDIPGHSGLARSRIGKLAPGRRAARFVRESAGCAGLQDKPDYLSISLRSAHSPCSEIQAVIWARDVKPSLARPVGGLPSYPGVPPPLIDDVGAAGDVGRCTRRGCMTARPPGLPSDSQLPGHPRQRAAWMLDMLPNCDITFIAILIQIREINEVLLKVARLLSLVLVTGLSIVLCTGCSSGGDGRTSPPPDPSTAAQINARLLISGTAPGFLEAHASNTAERSTHAEPFVSPSGGPNQVCTQLAAPELFRPGGVLDTGEYISVANAKRYGAAAPSWFEYIDVYPGTEAADLVKTLAALIRRCGHFQFTYGGAPGTKALPATEVAAPMRGLGSQALYVTVRVAVGPGVFQVLDWVLIRADRTLIWIVDQSSSSRARTGRDALTMRLAQDAWRHYRRA